MTCIVCHSPHQFLKTVCSTTKSVASDCKQVAFASNILQCENCGHYQKKTSKKYLSQVQSIYSTYTPYSLNKGIEQLNFTTDVPFSRCHQIINHCLEHLPTKQSCRYIDIGTGSGAMLQAIDAHNFAWQKYAQDVSNDKADRLRKKHHLIDFFSVPLECIDLQFDIVTLIHVLEHIIEPKEFLASLSNSIGEGGIAIIQVPNIQSNYWDFAIFDHVSHFSRQTLYTLLSPYFGSIYFPEQQIAKEITVIVSNKTSMSTSIRLETKLDVISQPEPHTLFNTKREQLSALQDAYVLGTGPAACYCAYELGNKLLGFLDEDSNKFNKYIFDKKILDAHSSFSQPIFLPYPLAQVKDIIKRLPQNRYEF